MDFPINIDERVLRLAAAEAVEKAFFDAVRNPSSPIAQSVRKRIDDYFEHYDFAADVDSIMKGRAAQQHIEEIVHEALKRKIRDAIKREPQMLVSMAEKA